MTDMFMDAANPVPPQPVPVVLVGCGAVSHFFYAAAIQALAPLGWITLRALVDPAPINRKRLSSRFPEAEACEHLQNVRLTRDDLVIVATPPRFHAPLAIHALEQGASVLVEKPISCSVDEGLAMLEAERCNPGFLAVGHVRRFYASTQALQELIQGGLLGDLRRFEIRECAGGWQAASDSFYRPEVAGGGVFLDVGIHILDQLDAWLGSPEEVVYADDAMGGLEANAVCRLHYASGAQGVLRLSKERTFASRHDFDFEKARVSWCVGKPDTLEFQWKGGTHALAGTLWRSRDLPAATDPQSFIEQLRHVAAVKLGLETNLRIPAEQALRALRVVEKAYASRNLLHMPWQTPAERQEAAGRAQKSAHPAVGGVSQLSTLPCVAITGASGFVGTRLVEMMHFGAWDHQPVPLVRGPNSLARLARFPLHSRFANLFDVESTASALSGCETLVHAALGDPRQIVTMASVISEGCARAGVKRLVVLSSAAVFGLVAPKGSDDETIPNPPADEAYAVAKWRAEKIFQAAAKKHGFECVILRPSLIYGPRSARMERIWNALEKGVAGVVDQGRGVFNGIYVDNLVEAIRLALCRPGITGKPFYVGDAEPVTWAEVYQAFGADPGRLPGWVPPAKPRPGLAERVRSVAAHPFAQKVLPFIPWSLKATSKRLLAALPEPVQPAVWTPLREDRPVETDFELAWLQTTQWRFSSARAHAELGYQPLVAFEEGMRRTLMWMDFPNA